MDPITLPESFKVIALKQYHMPGGQDEITNVIKEYIKVGVSVPTITPWNSPIWPIQKSDGTWRMTVDYRQLNKVTPPLYAILNRKDSEM